MSVSLGYEFVYTQERYKIEAVWAQEQIPLKKIRNLKHETKARSAELLVTINISSSLTFIINDFYDSTRKATGSK